MILPAERVPFGQEGPGMVETVGRGCRCAEDGGEACFARARADALASGDQKEVDFVDAYYRARKASGAAYHITDIAALERLAVGLLRRSDG